MQGRHRGWSIKATPRDDSTGPSRPSGKWQRTEGRIRQTGEMNVQGKETWEGDPVAAWNALSLGQGSGVDSGIFGPTKAWLDVKEAPLRFWSQKRQHWRCAVTHTNHLSLCTELRLLSLCLFPNPVFKSLGNWVLSKSVALYSVWHSFAEWMNEWVNEWMSEWMNGWTLLPGAFSYFDFFFFFFFLCCFWF